MLYRPNSLWTWAALLVSLVQLLATVAMEGYIVATCYLAKSDLSNLSIINSALFGLLVFLTLGFFYQLLLLYDTLAKRNTIQVIGICLYAASLCIYSGLQYNIIMVSIDFIDFFVVNNSPNPEFSNILLNRWNVARKIAIAIASTTGAFTVLLCYVSWRLYDEFAWELFKFIDADRRRRRMFLTFQIFISLLKFNLFFSLGYLLQFILFATFDTPNNKIEVSIFIVLSTLLGPIASAYVRQEKLLGAIVATIFHIALLAFFIYKLVDIWIDDSLEGDQLALERQVLTFWGCTTIVLTASTIAIEIMCMKNFGNGLKPYIASDTQIQELQANFETRNLLAIGSDPSNH